MFELVLGVLTLFFGLCIFMLARNERVSAYRLELISRIGNASRRDIDNGNFDYHWRWEEYETVSYNDMMLKFWKRLDSFYETNPARSVR